MPMLAQAGIAGLSALTGALSNRASNRTSNYNDTQTSTETGSSTSRRNLTPYQDAIQGPLFDYISKLFTDPNTVTQPFRESARNQVNQNYSGLADTLRQQFMGTTGGGQSGKFGSALATGQLQRLGQLSNVDNSFAQQNAQLQQGAAGIAQNLLGMDFGRTVDTTASSTMNRSGTQVGAGSPLAGGFQGGTAALSQLLSRALMGGG